VASALAAVVLVSLWLVLPAVLVTLIRQAASSSDELTVSLLALLDSRAPPAHLVLA
jgi:hypothetical protein